jgi:hypothetical protein
MKWKEFRWSRTGERNATPHTEVGDNKHAFCLDPCNCQCTCTTCKHRLRAVRKERP